eukprot:jgi/Mesvir1/6072/Mv00800-RA.1
MPTKAASSSAAKAGAAQPKAKAKAVKSDVPSYMRGTVTTKSKENNEKYEYKDVRAMAEETKRSLQARNAAQAQALKKMMAVTAAQIKAWNAASLAKTSADEILALRPDQLAAISADAARGLTREHLSNFTGQQMRALSAEVIATLSEEQLAALSPTQIKALSANQLSSLRPDQIKLLDARNLQAFNARQASRIAPAHQEIVRQWAKGQGRAAEASAFLPGGASDEEGDDSAFKFWCLTRAQVRLLPPSLTRVMKLVCPRDIEAMRNGLARVDATGGVPRLALLSATQLAGVAPCELAAASPEAIGALLPSQVAALTGDQLTALTPEQLARWGGDQLAAITQEQLAALPEVTRALLLFAQSAKPPGSAQGGRTRSRSPSGAHLASSSPSKGGLMLPPATPWPHPVVSPAVATWAASASLADVTAAQVQLLTPEHLAALALAPGHGEALRALPLHAVAALSQEQLRALGAQGVAALAPEQLNAMTPQQLAALTPPQVAALMDGGGDHLDEATRMQLLVLEELHRAHHGVWGGSITSRGSASARAGSQGPATLSLETLSRITPEHVAAGLLSGEQMAALTPEQLAVLSPQALAALPPGLATGGLMERHIAALSAAQLAALPPALLASLTAHQLAAFTQKQLAAAPPEVRAAITAGLAVREAEVSGAMARWPQAEWAELTSGQLAMLSSATLRSLATFQLAAVTPEALQGLSPSQLAALSPDQVAGLLPAQLEALLAMPHLRRSLSAEQLAALTLKQLGHTGCHKYLAALTDGAVSDGDSEGSRLFFKSLAALSREAVELSLHGSSRGRSDVQDGSTSYREGRSSLDSDRGSAHKGSDAGAGEEVEEELVIILVDDPADCVGLVEPPVSGADLVLDEDILEECEMAWDDEGPAAKGGHVSKVRAPTVAEEIEDEFEGQELASDDDDGDARGRGLMGNGAVAKVSLQRRLADMVEEDDPNVVSTPRRGNRKPIRFNLITEDIGPLEAGEGEAEPEDRGKSLTAPALKKSQLASRGGPTVGTKEDAAKEVEEESFQEAEEEEVEDAADEYGVDEEEPEMEGREDDVLPDDE